ncbi:MAG: N-acetyltransferase [Sphingomonas fennica]
MIRIAPLSAADPAGIEALLDAAFGADRHGRTAYRLRAGERPIAPLSFCALAGDRLAGTIQCWPLALEAAGARVPLVLVGPVAVDPAMQGEGIGRRLMETMLAAADGGAGGPGADALVLIGDPEYYGRFFGFAAAATGGWTLPGPFERHRLLARLAPGRSLPAKGALAPRG